MCGMLTELHVDMRSTESMLGYGLWDQYFTGFISLTYPPCGYCWARDGQDLRVTSLP